MEHPVAYARRTLVNLAIDDAKRRSRRRRELEPLPGTPTDACASGPTIQANSAPGGASEHTMSGSASGSGSDSGSSSTAIGVVGLGGPPSGPIFQASEAHLTTNAGQLYTFLQGQVAGDVSAVTLVRSDGTDVRPQSLTDRSSPGGLARRAPPRLKSRALPAPACSSSRSRRCRSPRVRAGHLAPLNRLASPLARITARSNGRSGDAWRDPEPPDHSPPVAGTLIATCAQLATPTREDSCRTEWPRSWR